MENLPNAQVIDLLNRIRRHDDQAARELYAFYRNPVFQYVRSRIGGNDATHDIVQETMAAAFASDKYDGSSLYSTWLIGIARNQIGTWLRDRKRHPEASEEEQDPDNPGWGSVADVLAHMEEAEFEHAFQTCIEKLPEKQRLVIRMILEGGVGLQAAAHELSLREGTVKSRAFHARIGLQRCLERVFPPASGRTQHG